MRTEVTSVKEFSDIHSMGHTCANLNGDLLFVWGGTNENVAYIASKNSSIWIYETLTGYWRHRTCSGECPPYLSSCASCLIGQKMYVFGGHSTAQDNWMNGLYCLDLETFIWADLGSQAQARPTKPIRSDKNVAWSFGSKFYIFGGYGWSQVERYLELLDCQKDLQLAPDQRWPRFGWNNQLVEYNPSEKLWTWPHYTGKCPSARAAHSGALMGDTYYVFGGRDSHERLNDLYKFDMHTFNWQQVAVLSSDPSTPPLRPIRHLLEPREEDEGAGEVVNVLVGNSENDLDLEEDHRQIVEEMHEVSVDDDNDDEDETRRDPALPSSSGQPEVEKTGENISENLDVFSKPMGQDEDEEDDFEHPLPSHLLERWSLSSNSTDNNLDCSQGAATANQVSTAQSVLLFNNLHLVSQELVTGDQSQAMQQFEANDQDQDGNQQEQQRGQSRAVVRLPAGQSLAPSREPTAPDLLNQDHEAVGRAQAEFQAPLALTNADTSTSCQALQQRPTGRSFCSLTPISDSNMLLFGGVNTHDQNLDDCWVFNVKNNRWNQIDYKHKLLRPRLWHTGSRTKQNEVIIIGGSCSEKIDEYCADVLIISLEPKSLKRLALDAVSRSVRMKTIQRTRGLPSTLSKLIRLRKQAMAMTTHRPANQPASHQIAPRR